MNQRTVKNLAASIHQKLLNKAKSEKRPFQELLQYYAMERFLYRLSVSKHRSEFILKGALALTAVRAPQTRPTRDIDFKGEMPNDIDDVVIIVKDICTTSVVDDGFSFDADTVSGVVIDDDDEYSGVRVIFKGLFGKARVPMQLDIGFGDVVVPKPKEIKYPTLLDFPNPVILVYPFESTIAEKFEAMVYLGEVNSRMKDFYDIWFLSRYFDFKGQILQDAIESTFKTRSTEIPIDLQVLLEKLTSEDKSRQWAAFLKRSNISDCPSDFSAVLKQAESFLGPICRSAVSGQRFESKWTAADGWRPGGRDL